MRQSGRQYELKEAIIRLAKGRTLYSDRAISNTDEAVEVMRRELMEWDREVLCVVNLNAKMKPINFNIVSVGNLNQTVADIPFITKSAICSGAAAMILAHAHPSGDPAPSEEDIELTKRVVEAGKLIGISCVDHVIVGCGTGCTFSMREQEVVDFEPAYRGVTADDIMNVAQKGGCYHRKEESVDLSKAGKDELIRELEKRGVKCLDPDDVFAAKIWCREDIADVIREYDPDRGDRLAQKKTVIDAVIEHGGNWSYLTDCTEGEWECITEEVSEVLSWEVWND